MALKRLTSGVRKTERYILDAVSGLFLTILLGLAGYWIYEVDKIYNEAYSQPEDATIQAAKVAAIFQAAVLTFFLAILSLRFSRRI